MSFDTKYRPKQFSDVLGQSASIAIMRRFVASRKAFRQSYLIAGPFGSGKTTLGRILARAMLCQNPTQGGDPCDECDSCVSMLAKSSVNFVEIDAATNSGKADVQRIIEDIQYTSFAGGRKLYLFDEAHQLSRDALDALLKPLEEDADGSEDKRLVCIFCTTEPEKMRPTVFSRCAPSFIVQPVSPSDIAQRLAMVCDAENIGYDIDTLKTIAELSECHIRDAMKSIEGVSLLGDVNRENAAKYLKLDVYDSIAKTVLSLMSDLPSTIESVRSMLLSASPAFLYEKIIWVCMTAYQAGVGAVSLPSYVDSALFSSLFSSLGSRLIQIANTLSSRPAKPTESSLLCDLSMLHFGGHFVATNIQDRIAVPVDTTPVPAVVASRPPVPPPVPQPVNGRADVRVSRRAVGGYNTDIRVAQEQQAGPSLTVDSFAELVAIAIAEGMTVNGSTRSLNMGGS